MKTLKIQESQKILSVTLSRPDVKNAFNEEMIRELSQCFRTLNSRNDLRAVFLQGEGSAFCAGADLNYMKSMVQFSLSENQKDADRLFEMFELISQCPFPVAGWVRGAAMGGALGLISSCDIVLAEEKTQFCFSEVKLGLVPAVISPFVLKKVSRGQAGPYMLSGKVFSSTEALQMGLIHQIFSEKDFAKNQEEISQLFQNAGPHSVRATKKLLLNLPQMVGNEVREEVTRVIAERRASDEGQEGLRSFLEKRSPQWRSQ